MMSAIDLATETAEGFVLPPFGIPLEDLAKIELADSRRRFHYRHLQERHDHEVLRYVSSAYLACGAHSGDPVLMRRVAVEAVALGISLGAHPSYPDGFGFGQERVSLRSEDLEAVLLYQLGALASVVRGVGASLKHVKCHGALSFDISYEERFCATMVKAVKRFDPEMIVVFMAGSPGLRYARETGLRVASEAYVDRGYERSGRLVPRNHPQALIGEPAEAAKRILEIANEGKVTCVDGTRIDIAADTVCLHSDTRGAREIAAAVSAALKNHGIAVRPLAEIVG